MNVCYDIKRYTEIIFRFPVTLYNIKYNKKKEIDQSDGYIEVKLPVNTRDNFRPKNLIFFTIFKVLVDFFFF